MRQGVSLGFDELMAMPSVTRTATLECAGNGRVFLVPQTEGAQWELGAVSTAEWTGVPLRAVLERAGLLDGSGGGAAGGGRSGCAEGGAGAAGRDPLCAQPADGEGG